MPSYMKILSIAFALVLAMLAIAVVPASADQHFISGRVVNQTPGAEPPSGLQVVLTIFEEGTPIGQLTATTDADGAFAFEDIPRVWDSATFCSFSTKVASTRPS